MGQLKDILTATADIYQYVEPSFQSFTQEMKILSDFIECIIGDNQNLKIHDGKKKKKNNQ